MSTRQQRRQLAGLVGWFLLLVVAIGLVTTWSDPRLATPALTDPSAWPDWSQAREPVIAAVAIMRLVLIGLTWYLLGATTIQVLARLTRSIRLLRVANALSIPLVRRVVSSGLGVSLAATMVTAATGTHPGPTRFDHVRTTTTTTAVDQATVDTGAAVDLPTMRLGPRDGHDDGPTVPMMMEATPAQSTKTPSMRPTDHAGTWTVSRGDHLWNIAERVMAEHLGTTPDDHQVTPYWQRLIAANRSRLPDPDNADLILPGMQLVLPDPTATTP